MAVFSVNDPPSLLNMLTLDISSFKNDRANIFWQQMLHSEDMYPTPRIFIFLLGSVVVLCYRNCVMDNESAICEKTLTCWDRVIPTCNRTMGRPIQQITNHFKNQHFKYCLSCQLIDNELLYYRLWLSFCF